MAKTKRIPPNSTNVLAIECFIALSRLLLQIKRKTLEVRSPVMPWTANQTSSFFENNDQMGIPNRTVMAMRNEGISTIDDLAEFEDDDFKAMVESFRNPPLIPDPNNAARQVRQNPFQLGARSLKRLKVAAQAVRYYQSTARATTAANMQWNTVLQNFADQWQSILDQKKDETPDVPKITRNFKVPRWSETFSDFLHRVIGVRNAPLAYVIRPDESVSQATPTLAHGQPFSVEHESVENEMIARLSHVHALFKDDNAKVYHYLEEATRATIYSSTLTPFKRRKNGRGAFLALLSQHAGDDKWEKDLRTQETFLKTRVWKGNTTFSLEKFIEQHRAAYISMTQAADHVPFQLPNERTRLTYLLDAIQCNDATLQAALAAINMDNEPNGMRNDFEKAATYLLPSCPVAKRRKTTGNFNANVSSAASLSKTGLKDGIGTTGVRLGYHTGIEYAKLSAEQRQELYEWRSSKGVSKKSNKRSSYNSSTDDGSNKKMRKIVSSLIKEERKKEEKKEAQASKDIEQIKEIFSTIIDEKRKPDPAKKAASIDNDKAHAMAVQLRSIMQRKSKKGSDNDSDDKEE